MCSVAVSRRASVAVSAAVSCPSGTSPIVWHGRVSSYSGSQVLERSVLDVSRQCRWCCSPGLQKHHWCSLRLPLLRYPRCHLSRVDGRAHTAIRTGDRSRVLPGGLETDPSFRRPASLRTGCIIHFHVRHCCWGL